MVLKIDNPVVWPIYRHMGTHGMHMMMVYEAYEQSAEGHEEHA